MGKRKMPQPSRGTTKETSAFCRDAVSGTAVAKKRTASSVLQRATVAVGKCSVRVDRTSPASKTAPVKRADQSARKDAQLDGKERQGEDIPYDSDEFDVVLQISCLRYGARGRAGLGLAASRTAPPRPKSARRAKRCEKSIAASAQTSSES